MLRLPLVHSMPLNWVSTAIRRYDGSGSSVLMSSSGTFLPRCRLRSHVGDRVDHLDAVAAAATGAEQAEPVEVQGRDEDRQDHGEDDARHCRPRLALVLAGAGADAEAVGVGGRGGRRREAGPTG